MGLKTQKAVIAELDKAGGRHLHRARRDYRDQVVGLLLEELAAAGSGQEALERLGAGLLHRMSDEATKRRSDEVSLEEAIAGASVQSALIGRASARPPERRTKGRGDAGT